MAHKFNKEQRIYMLQLFWKYDKATARIHEDFRTRFPNAPLPTRQHLRKLNIKFERTGNVADALRSGRPRYVRNEENSQIVAQAFVASPHKSTRKASAQLGISRRSLQRILKDIKFKPFRPKLLHALHEDDYDRRLQFCELFLVRNEADPNFWRSILWTDEASFKLNGHVNRHNCVYWSDTNPHEVMEKDLNVPGLNVWGGISSIGLIGPYFFEGTVTSAAYLEMMQNFAVPEMENNHIGNFIWQQDGAPPHYGLIVRNFLSTTFREWIGRRGTFDWPPRSCDLTPCDFSLWGILKDMVFSTSPTNLDELRTSIENAFHAMNEDKLLLSRICGSVVARCLKCIEQEGGQFEQQ